MKNLSAIEIQITSSLIRQGKGKTCQENKIRKINKI